MLTYEVILWVVIAMGLLTDLPIRQVFKHARRLRAGEESPGRSNLCIARRRLGVAPVRHLFGQVVRPLGRPETPGAFYRGLRLMGIDGTVLDVPDSAANAAAFGRPSAGPRGDGAFPQVRKLSLVELGTHAEVAFVVKPCRGDERAMVAGLLRHLTPGMSEGRRISRRINSAAIAWRKAWPRWRQRVSWLYDSTGCYAPTRGIQRSFRSKSPRVPLVGRGGD